MDVRAKVSMAGDHAAERGPRPVAAAEEAHLRRAFELARNGLGLASPNPMVGAVVVDASGAVAGEGWHEGPGTPHAEAVALREAGERSRGGTLFVTLEPCNHQGRRPPCAPAIVRAGVARVVASVSDPNPSVTGGGFDVLRSSGVAVTRGALAREGDALIEAFAKAVTTRMPWVTLKTAMSLDGKVAARDGSSRWITSEEARADAHRLRAGHDAVLVGSGTALADDPALTVRIPGYRGRQPVRIVLDSSGRTPATRRLFDGAAPVVVGTSGRAPAVAREAWSSAGARVITVPDVVRDHDGDGGGVDIGALLAVLATEADSLRSVLIEGGPTVAASAVREGVVDRFVVYLAPKLIGDRDAPGALERLGVASVADAFPLEIESVERVGSDIRIVATPAGRNG